jgi:hypothetical protein
MLQNSTYDYMQPSISIQTLLADISSSSLTFFAGADFCFDSS